MRTSSTTRLILIYLSRCDHSFDELKVKLDNLPDWRVTNVQLNRTLAKLETEEWISTYTVDRKKEGCGIVTNYKITSDGYDALYFITGSTTPVPIVRTMHSYPYTLTGNIMQLTNTINLFEREIDKLEDQMKFTTPALDRLHIERAIDSRKVDINYLEKAIQVYEQQLKQEVLPV